MANKKGGNNPLGRKADRLMSDALRIVLNEVAKDAETKRELKDENGKAIRKIRLVADKLVEKALGGDIMAIKECFDRIEGKPMQAIDLQGDMNINYVARMPDMPETTDEWLNQHAPKTIQ